MINSPQPVRVKLGVGCCMPVDPPHVGPHVPDHADLVNDVSGTEFVLMHCARCGSQVAMKLDAERNVTARGFCRMRPSRRL
jgi:hypothetical protein